MNCLIEALGLALPGNSLLLATHIDLKRLFINASKCIINLTKKYYINDDCSILPCNIANKEAFENAMILDIAMVGSTNTILHLLAAAQEAEVNFTISDIDLLSRKTPPLCNVSPNSIKYHIEDVHRAVGVFGILGELNRADLINKYTYNILGLL